MEIIQYFPRRNVRDGERSRVLLVPVLRSTSLPQTAGPRVVRFGTL